MKFYTPVTDVNGWQALLAEPEKQWKDGYSAKLLAEAWQNAKGFPQKVQQVFQSSGIGLFQTITPIIGFPEFKVPLPGGTRESQNDIFLIAKSSDQLISITVEGKVAETFGPTISEWHENVTPGKDERLKFLCNKLDIRQSVDIRNQRYQLFHRTASAMIMAEEFNAKNALMLVHSFSDTSQWFEDYCNFVALFGLKGQKDKIVGSKTVNGMNLYFGWVKGV